MCIRDRGTVEVRGGSGIYVSQGSVAPAPGFLPPSDPGPFEVLRARCLIESEIAAAAAVHRTDADIDRIFESLSAMRQNLDDKAANDAADRQFHLGIAQATGNNILLHMVSALSVSYTHLDVYKRQRQTCVLRHKKGINAFLTPCWCVIRRLPARPCANTLSA